MISTSTGSDFPSAPDLDFPSAPDLDFPSELGLNSSSKLGLNSSSKLGLNSSSAPGLSFLSAPGLSFLSAPGLNPGRAEEGGRRKEEGGRNKRKETFSLRLETSVHSSFATKTMHSNSEIYLHLCWSTKYSIPLIKEEYEHKTFQFIKSRFKKNDCAVLAINGTADHVHCLIRMVRHKSIAEIMKDVKGSSAFYINQNKLCSSHFYWQTGYWAGSVDVYRVKSVTRYINRQKEHPRKGS